MGNRINTERPRWAMIASIALLIWNLIGVGAFVSQATMAPEAIAALPTEQRDLWLAMPMWNWVAYAVAVLSGVGGAVALLLRKRWAVPLSLLCIVGVIVQFSYPFSHSDALRDPAMAAFPVFILVMAIGQWLLARNWRAKGWLN
jgi:hypothetical protein